MWISSQAEGTCEDYNPETPEGSMSSFNASSLGPTPSSALTNEQPVTRGTDNRSNRYGTIVHRPGGTKSGESRVQIDALKSSFIAKNSSVLLKRGSYFLDFGDYLI